VWASLGSLSCRDVLTPHQGRTAPVETNGRMSPPPPVSCHLPPSCSQKQHNNSATAVPLTNHFCSFDLSVEHGVEIRTPRENLPLHQATNAILLLQQQCQTPHRVLSRHRSHHHIIIIKQQAIALRQLRRGGMPRMPSR
jgi:hypothetical protein